MQAALERINFLKGLIANELEHGRNPNNVLDNLLKDSALIVLPGTHYCYLENLHQIISILNNLAATKDLAIHLAA